VAGGNTKVSLIVDDLESVDPWRPRGIKVHGVAEIVHRDGRFGAQEYLAIAPTVTWSWGLGEQVFQGGRFAPRKTVWRPRE
jgi:pyridoxamine 5'-phosphate oxidase family protein